MRAILVSVDYADLLAITLPYNKHHFESVMVVTSPADIETVAVATICGAQVFVTGSFYERGAIFNKWLALEQGLDHIGREGWICIMDADVLWPKEILGKSVNPENNANWMSVGNLYSPLRRMMSSLPYPFALPSEDTWSNYPIHRNVNEWAGYTQIFHADDPHLGPAPWHETSWRHAGGADSMFQRKWPAECKVRPTFEVLHLGPAGTNWCGRATPYLDGRKPARAGERLAQLQGFMRSRRRTPGRFAEEKLD